MHHAQSVHPKRARQHAKLVQVCLRFSWIDHRGVSCGGSTRRLFVEVHYFAESVMEGNSGAPACVRNKTRDVGLQEHYLIRPVWDLSETQRQRRIDKVANVFNRASQAGSVS